MKESLGLIEQMALIAAEIEEREAKDCEELVKKLDSIIKRAWEAHNSVERRSNLQWEYQSHPQA